MGGKGTGCRERTGGPRKKNITPSESGQKRPKPEEALELGDEMNVEKRGD